MVLVGPKVSWIKDIGPLTNTQPGSHLLYFGLGGFLKRRLNSDMNCLTPFGGNVQMFYKGVPSMFGYAYDTVRYPSQEIHLRISAG